jgi:hypothetical protein
VDDEKPSPFADLVTGAAWLAVSIGIVIGAWRMDRLEHLAATIYTVPGLVPGLLGAALALMALLLMLRGLRGGALGAFPGKGLPPTRSGVHTGFPKGNATNIESGQARGPRVRLLDHWRLIAALGLALAFAVGLLGRGLPFWLAAALYVAAMVFWFQYEDRRRDGTLLRGAAFAAVFGVISGLVVHFAFQDIFLVRLP